MIDEALSLEFGEFKGCLPRKIYPQAVENIFITPLY